MGGGVSERIGGPEGASAQAWAVADRRLCATRGGFKKRRPPEGGLSLGRKRPKEGMCELPHRNNIALRCNKVKSSFGGRRESPNIAQIVARVRRLGSPARGPFLPRGDDALQRKNDGRNPGETSRRWDPLAIGAPFCAKGAKIKKRRRA
jgi:hypothetical protein